MRTFIGIDPGLEGAVAALTPTDRRYAEAYAIQVHDTPTGKTLGSKGKRIYMERQMVRLLTDIWKSNVEDVPLVYIERVHSMPKQGVASSFNFGMGYGLWQGIVAGLGWSMELVTPQQWMKVMMAGQLRGKDPARARAQELWPHAMYYFERVKDHGRADAALLCEYGRRTYNADSPLTGAAHELRAMSKEAT